MNAKMRALTASLVGISSKTTWSTTATINLGSAELYFAGGFTGDEQAPHEGRRLVKLLEGLPNPDSQAVYQAIESFFKELHPQTSASVAMIFKQGEKTTLFCYGFGVAILARGARGRWLADGSKEQVILEGEARPGDLFLLATARALDLGIEPNQLTGLVPDDISAQFFSRVQAHPKTGEISVLSIQIQAKPADVGEETGQKMDETAEEDIRPTLSAQNLFPTHLISPEKLERGVMASDEEKTTRIKKTLASPELLANLRRGLHDKKNLVRAGIGAGIIGLLIIFMVLYRGANLAREHDSVVVPLEQLTTEVLSLPPDKIAEQRVGLQSLLERLRATRVVYGANMRRVAQLLAEVEQKNSEVSGEKQVVNLPIFYDFRLVSSEFLASKAAREKNRAVFLDSGKGSLLSLNLDTKQNETFPHDGIEAAKDLAVLESTAYVLQAGSVMKSAASSSKAEVAKNLPSLTEPFLLDRFGDSLYVLDRAGQQIWRVGASDESTPSGWVRSAKGIDFSSVTSMSINGSIWLGSSDGNIYALAHGERQSFNVSGLAQPFTSTLLLAVTPEGEKLVAVEPARSRLVVMDKQGQYLMQVESEQIGAVTDVFLSEDEHSVYLTAGSVVYKVEI